MMSIFSQAMHAAPMYIAETAPTPIRGQLISLKEFFIVLGMVVSSYNFPRDLELTLCALLSTLSFSLYCFMASG